ncbi:g13477 [Coccomyxa viridis]|uniref:G13477 protein n=1 Tax=Coccomyxa viridis TaxID=1274662 RepID=A0ABP1GDS5_9CHLO
MSRRLRSAAHTTLLCILAISQVVVPTDSRYIVKEESLRTCPRARFPATNYAYRIPPESVWEVVAAKHATSSQSSEHAVVVAYVSDKDPWSRSMGNSTLACLHRFYRQRDLVFLIVRYEDMSINEQMQHRIGNLPAFRILSQGRRYVADGQQSLRDLVDTIEARTGVSPVGPVEVLQSEEARALLGCNDQVDEVIAEDFARAGRGFWLDAAVLTLQLLSLRQPRKCTCDGWSMRAAPRRERLPTRHVQLRICCTSEQQWSAPENARVRTDA